ncbi:MAG: septal ring lytic transglycosylase RlpA family protein [Stellaceae bacterium]
MPLRRTIGISLALMMASAGAMAKTPETGTTHQSSQPPDSGHQKATDRTGKTRIAHRFSGSRRSSRLAWRRPGRVRYERQAVGDQTDSAGAAPYWGPRHATGALQIGRAAWYDLVGDRTSSGERLNTVTPTAAHRSLPLGSCAKVTDLDTGRSIIVKINDRGPYNRRFIIDLSPRAAEELGMRYVGVAAVAVEPVAAPVAAVTPAVIIAPATAAVRPSFAAYRTTAINVTQ